MASATTNDRLWKYDVFLSFQGDDVRKNFLDHLYSTLRRKGVYAFKDDKELERGKGIEDGLVQAIRDSRFCIIIFSTRYADSRWCLDELLTIYERVQQGKQTAFPVFYRVDPFDVQNLKGNYGKAFEEHAEKYEDEIVQKWKVAITKLAYIAGWSLHDRHEVEFIEDIVETFLGQLRKLSPRLSTHIEDGLIGMEKHLQQLEVYLSAKPTDVCVIGICGMGGIGKTTIAKAFFDKWSSQFEGSSFLKNVREVEEKHSLTRLQGQLLDDIVQERHYRFWDTHKGTEEIQNRLGHKKVLVVLDDLNNIEQLNSLAGNTNWFGGGSRLIITTRNEHLLRFYEECLIYKVPEMDDNHAIKLFCLKAFRNISPVKDFEDLSHGVLQYCKGLPLAIDVLGSFLRGRKCTKEWESALCKLKENPNEDVLKKLKISFDDLDKIEQKIFLDIACFFKGMNKNRVERILESSNFYPDIGMRVLIDKSLITIDLDNKVQMHDMLQQMGREIVKQECPKNNWERSRLWRCDDFYDFLLNNKELDLVEGIMIQDSHEVEVERFNTKALIPETFSKLTRLRLLKLQYLHVDRGHEFLPNSLVYLSWHKLPLNSLPVDFHPNNIVELHLCYSNITLLWEGVKPLKMLRVLNLSYSKKLKRTPDFREVPKLEKLNLKGCMGLLQIHDSIGLLEELVSLNLSECSNLTTLPSTICDVKSLKILNLSGCSSLDKLPERLGELTNLETLNWCRKREVEQFFVKPWDFLMPWKRSSSSMPLTLPLSVSNLCFLSELNLSYCHLKGGLPNDLSCFPSLQTLDLRGNDLVTIPTSIKQLSKLIKLNLGDCRMLEAVPELPSHVWNLNLYNCSSLVTFAPFETYFNDDSSAGEDVNWFMWHKRIRFASWRSNSQNLQAGVLSGQLPNYAFSMFMPGDTIPGWFNIQSSDASLTAELDGKPYVDWASDYPGEHEYQFGQLYVCFYPLSAVQRTMDWWNKVRKIEIHFKGERIRVKSVGFRIVYEQDRKELLRYISSSKSQKSVIIGKDYCNDGGQESNGRGGSATSMQVAPLGPAPPGPPGQPGFCGFFDVIVSCLSFLCCSWLLQDCFGGPPGPPRPP